MAVYNEYFLYFPIVRVGVPTPSRGAVVVVPTFNKYI